MYPLQHILLSNCDGQWRPQPVCIHCNTYCCQIVMVSGDHSLYVSTTTHIVVKLCRSVEAIACMYQLQHILLSNCDGQWRPQPVCIHCNTYCCQIVMVSRDYACMYPLQHILLSNCDGQWRPQPVCIHCNTYCCQIVTVSGDHSLYVSTATHIAVKLCRSVETIACMYPLQHILLSNYVGQ